MDQRDEKPAAARKQRGSIWNRGTKDRPQWYCRYVDVDGTRKTKHTHQPSKELAETFLRNIKANVARGHGELLGHRPARPQDDFELSQILRDLGCHVPKERETATMKTPRERVWHTFRHTLSSALTEAGATGDAISRILGHAGAGSGAATMTLSYTHVSLAGEARRHDPAGALPARAADGSGGGIVKLIYVAGPFNAKPGKPMEHNVRTAEALACILATDWGRAPSGARC